MKNKKELTTKKSIEASENKKRLGIILLIMGITVLIIGILIIIYSFGLFTKSALIIKPAGAIQNIYSFIIGIIINMVAVGTIVAGTMLIVINNKKIAKYTKETVIPKAKETYHKVEPVVTDAIKNVGEGFEKAANSIKDAIDKNKKNKKGE